MPDLRGAVIRNALPRRFRLANSALAPLSQGAVRQKLVLDEGFIKSLPTVTITRDLQHR